MNEFSLLSAFIVGLLGAGHCLSMCGGLMASFAMTIPNYNKFTFWQKLPYLLNYNIARIISYSAAGFIVAIGSEQLSRSQYFSVDIFTLISGVMLLLLGLYISGLWSILTKLERVGGVLWRHVSPLAKRFLPLTKSWKAIPLGLLWGWLPCGLTYSMLTWSLASADAIQGSLIMLMFGLGTLPLMLATGIAANTLTQVISNRYFRLIAGICLITYSQWVISLAIIRLIS